MIISFSTPHQPRAADNITRESSKKVASERMFEKLFMESEFIQYIR